MSRVPESPLMGFERRLLDTLAEADARRLPAARAAGLPATVRTNPARVATRPRRMRPAMLAAVGAALVAGTAFVGLVSGTPTPGHRSADPSISSTPATVNVRPVAFVVMKNGDGSVTFTAHDLVDADAATKALNDAGIAGKVINASGKGCSGKSSNTNPGSAKHPGTITIRSSMYPASGGVLLVVNPRFVDPQTGKSLPAWLMVFVADHAKKIPSCVDHFTKEIKLLAVA
jgi:hypothetical protein